MAQTTIPYRLVRGIKSSYSAATYANDVYFATDTHEIFLDGHVYGGDATFLAELNTLVAGSVKNVQWDPATRTLKLIRNNGATDISCILSLATTSAAGLMSAAQVAALDGSVKSGSISGSTLTLTRNSGSQAVAIPSATTTVPGFMTTAQVQSLNSLTAFMATKGKAGGLAPLDASGKVPAENLPGFVDEIAYFLGPKSSVTNPTAVTPRTDTIATAAAADSVVYVVHNVTSGSTTSIKPTFCLKKGEYYYQKWTVPTSVSDLFQDWTYYMTSDFSPRKNVLFVRIDSTDATASGGVYRYGGGISLVEISAQINVINNLTSTSTTSALSAAQGKALNDKVLTAISGATFTSPGTFKFTNIAGTVVLNATIPDATTSTKGLMTTTHVSTLNASVKNVTSNVSATDVTFTITKNNNTTTTFGIVGATSSTAGLMTPTDKTTLSNVVNKANANATAITTLQQQNCWYEA